MFKKSAQIWVQAAAVMLAITAVGYIASLVSASGSAQYAIINGAVLVVLALIVCICLKEKKIVRGLSSRGYFITETLEGTVLEDFPGLTKDDLLGGLKQLKDYKESTGFVFSSDSLFDVLMVRFEDDTKQKIRVDRVSNTEKEDLIGYTTFDAEDDGSIWVKLSGRKLQLANIAGTAERLGSEYRGKLCRVTLVRPIESQCTSGEHNSNIKLLSKLTLNSWGIQDGTVRDSWGLLSNIEEVEG